MKRNKSDESFVCYVSDAKMLYLSYKDKTSKLEVPYLVMSLYGASKKMWFSQDDFTNNMLLPEFHTFTKKKNKR